MQGQRTPLCVHERDFLAQAILDRAVDFREKFSPERREHVPPVHVSDVSNIRRNRDQKNKKG
jgi:hypothetical protein